MKYSLPCEGEGWGGVLKQNQRVDVLFDSGFVFITPSQPPPSQGEEQRKTLPATPDVFLLPKQSPPKILNLAIHQTHLHGFTPAC